VCGRPIAGSGSGVTLLLPGGAPAGATIGATIGAALASSAACLHSPTAGIVAVIFFVADQQFENSVLQPVVTSRTVNVNALVVIRSVLLGVELFGIVGVVLAIPVAGATPVAARAAGHEYHQGRLRLEVPFPPDDPLDADAADDR
jgi:predicted PurR-regulated permease PerM